MTVNLTELAAKVQRATAAGHAAAATVDDGGTCNMDHVVIYLPRVREAAVKAAGINASKWAAGEFHLVDSFGGQANKRSAGVEAMAKALKAEGVECFIYYQMD